jgi:hypothetical protein
VIGLLGSRELSIAVLGFVLGFALAAGAVVFALPKGDAPPKGAYWQCFPVWEAP